MTKPIIYQLAYSPYCIPITQALSAVGHEFETREVPNWERGEILELTNGAYYQVPVIQFKDRIVYESGTDTLDVARSCLLYYHAETFLKVRKYFDFHCFEVCSAASLNRPSSSSSVFDG
jgi:hypothetical protein